jgi:hypothetical protein
MSIIKENGSDEATAEYNRPLTKDQLAEAHRKMRREMEESEDGVEMGVSSDEDAASLMKVREDLLARDPRELVGGSADYLIHEGFDNYVIGGSKETGVEESETKNEGDEEKERMSIYEKELVKIKGFNEEQRKELESIIQYILHDLNGEASGVDGRSSMNITDGLAIYLNDEKYKKVIVDGENMHFEMPIVCAFTDTYVYKYLREYLEAKEKNELEKYKKEKMGGLEDWNIEAIEEAANAVEYAKSLKKFIVIDNEARPL